MDNLLSRKSRFTAIMILALSLLMTDMGAPVSAQTVDPSTQPLVQFSNLKYLGAFRVPNSSSGGGDTGSINFGGRALGYNPGNPGSLFISCFAPGNLIAEISLPTPVISSDITKLPTAKFLQVCADPTSGGTMPNISNGFNIGGILVHNGKLITTKYAWYDGNAEQTHAFFVKGNTNLSQKNATGAYSLSGAPNIGFLDGHMTPIPSEWQTALKGPVLAGNNSLSIISRTSWGPDGFAFDPALLTNPATIVPAKPLFYYTSANHGLGSWDGPAPNNVSTWWNMAGTNGYRGAVIPGGTSSILYFGAQGMGPFCYGEGQNNPAIPNGTATSDGSQTCYDPVDGSKGTHGYPYQYQIMAFNLNELAAVAAGTKEPWAVKPYAVWPLNGIIGMNGKDNSVAGGTAYDPTTRRIYFSAPGSDTVVTYSNLPLIHVWQVVDIGTTPPVVIIPSAATITASVTKGAAPLSVSFTGSAQGTEPTYSWDFGDGNTGSWSAGEESTGSGATVNHIYTVAGNYTVTLTATNAAGSTSATVPITVTTSNTEFAISSNIPNGSVLSGSLDWIASVSGDASISQVDFYIDGVAKWTEKEAVYQYNGDPDGKLDTTTLSDGTHVLTVMATTSDNIKVSANTTVMVRNTVTPPAAVAPSGLTASASPTSGVAPLAVNLTAATTAGTEPVTYSWNFGDGSTATGALVSHIYNTAGSHTATVTATNSIGSVSQSVTITVTAAAPPPPPPPAPALKPPVVSASANVTSGNAWLKVAFTASASDPNAGGRITGYSWTFGDGAASTSRAPSHTYKTAGSYTATVTVTDNKGMSASKSVTITVAAPIPPTANPTATVGAKRKVTFVANATAAPNSSIARRAWDFGDGSTTTGAQVTHTYAKSGSYTVTLTVTDKDGGTVTKTLTVRVP